MDTPNPAMVEIPNIKLAKVGKDRERRRGAAAGLLGAAGSGSGAAVGAGMSLAKTLMLLGVISGISTGAWQFGRIMAGDSVTAARPAPKKAFGADAPQHYDDLSGVMQTETSIPNSVGYVSGSIDGLTPEERAKKQAEEEAARAAQEAADKKAQEEANKPQGDAPEAVPTDPNTVAENGKKGLAPGKFGQMANSFRPTASALSGGSGLSGGISRNFGGTSGVGGIQKGQAIGAAGPIRKGGKPGVTSTARSSVAKSHSKGFAKNQLMNAFALSRRASASGKAETASESATQAFEDNRAHGSVIEGPGLGLSAASELDHKPDNPTNPSGPLNTPPTCGAGQYVGSDGQCHTTQTTDGKKHFKFQWMIDAVQAAMLAITALIAMIMLWRHWLKVDFQLMLDTSVTGVGYGAACAKVNSDLAMIKGLLVAVAALGFTIVGLGVALMAYTHDLVTTGIIAAIGAVIGIYATVSAVDMWGYDDWITQAEMNSINSIPAVMGIMGSAGGAFSASSIHAKQNMD